MANQKRAIQSWLQRRKVREPTMSQASEYDLIAQGFPTKKQTFHQLDSENSLTHENECLKREIKIQRALIEELKGKAQKKAREHATTNRQKDQAITEYQNKIGRCKRTLEMMQNAGTSPSVMVEVMQDLINDIDN